MLDEFAFWDYQAEQLAALEAAGARIHIITTGNGPGDIAHKIWLQAERGEGPWKTIFLPWSAHPDRTQAWYASHVEAAIEPRLARREYAATPDDAFAAPEGIFFERFSRERNVAEITIVEELAHGARGRLRLPPPGLSLDTDLTGRPAVRRRRVSRPRPDDAGVRPGDPRARGRLASRHRPSRSPTAIPPGARSTCRRQRPRWRSFAAAV